MLFFPLIGVILGGLLFGARYVCLLLLPPLPANILVLAFWVILTGGLHLDGFIDCCDGLFSAKPADERLRILKDTHVGAFGVVGAVLLLLGKWSLLSSSAILLWPILIIAPAIARFLIVWAAWRYPSARPGGMGDRFRQGLTPGRVLLAAGFALLASAVFGRALGLVAALVAWSFSIIAAYWVKGRIGGLTGDVYGALCESGEVLVLLVGLLGERGL
jgi:adenosylcobinamide-GDP ribazoletransferase